jgi:hypothetical protein
MHAAAASTAPSGGKITLVDKRMVLIVAVLDGALLAAAWYLFSFAMGGLLGHTVLALQLAQRTTCRRGLSNAGGIKAVALLHALTASAMFGAAIAAIAGMSGSDPALALNAFFAAASLAVVSIVLYFVLTVITPPHLVAQQPAVVAQPAHATELLGPVYQPLTPGSPAHIRV